jgi:hypothetical protein
MHKTIRELHPDHCNALDRAKLSSKEEPPPTLHYMKHECIDLTYSKKELKKQKDAAGIRGVYFCISYSTFWKKPIHLILKDLKQKHKLQKWFRISMSYHRFPNMRDIFQSQLSTKMIENVESLGFNTREYNSRSPSGNCQHGKVCRVPTVVYKAKCKTSGNIYILGNTQQYFKNRMRGHFQDVKQLVEKNVYSDSYAIFLGGQVPKGARAPTPGMQRDLISCSIIWKGDPLTAVKSFGRKACKLCNREWKTPRDSLTHVRNSMVLVAIFPGSIDFH